MWHFGLPKAGEIRETFPAPGKRPAEPATINLPSDIPLRWQHLSPKQQLQRYQQSQHSKRLSLEKKKAKKQLGPSPQDVARESRRERNSEYVKELRNRPTRHELLVKAFLKDRGIGVNFQQGFYRPFHRIADFFFPFIDLIVEIDGRSHLQTVDLDRRKDAGAAHRGIDTLRFTNEQVEDGSYIPVLLAELKRRRAALLASGYVLAPRSLEWLQLHPKKAWKVRKKAWLTEAFDMRNLEV